MATKNTYFYALGRRKSATARVRLQGGKGNLTINGKAAADYLAGNQSLLNKLQEPFALVDKIDQFDVSAVVEGGGHVGQVDAVRLGIAKVLASMDENLKGTLKRADMLSRDPREKERKKFGLKGARKQRQFTKR